MTCEEYQPLMIDLARGLSSSSVGEAVQRGDVLSHIARCKRCAAWLAEQEALTEAFRATANADASLDAPPGVEANVMAAFRARQAMRQSSVASAASVASSASVARLASSARVARLASTEAVGSSTHTAPEERAEGMFVGLAGDSSNAAASAGSTTDARLITSARGWKPARVSWPAAGLAAAAAVIIFALSLASLRSLNAPPDTGGDSVPGRATNASAGAGSPTAVNVPAPAVGASKGPAVSGTNAAIVEVLPERGSKGRPAAPPVPPRKVTQRVALARRVEAGRRPNAARAASELSGPAFVLLPYAEPLRPTEMRHIMRVRMSRTLVVAGDVQAGNADGDGGTVLADVLVGEDGTARAVRIVQ